VTEPKEKHNNRINSPRGNMVAYTSYALLLIVLYGHLLNGGKKIKKKTIPEETVKIRTAEVENKKKNQMNCY
jgi:hypothetical protein